jgi:DNA-binding NarL/FixJ family response regulator
VVVNDDPALLEEISRFLIVHTSFDVAGVAMDGCAALETVGRLRPDLVVMDLRMPGMNGLDATEQLRRMFPAICILMTSADDGPELAELCRDYGADGFVSKRRLHSDLPAAVQDAFCKH